MTVMITILIVSTLWTVGAIFLFSFGRRIVQEYPVRGSIGNKRQLPPAKAGGL